MNLKHLFAVCAVNYQSFCITRYVTLLQLMQDLGQDTWVLRKWRRRQFFTLLKLKPLERFTIATELTSSQSWTSWTVFWKPSMSVLYKWSILSYFVKNFIELCCIKIKVKVSLCNHELCTIIVIGGSLEPSVWFRYR